MSKESINRQAAHWVVQLQSPDCLDSDREACIIWRAANADHDQAFLKASRLFGMLAEKLPADPMYASGHQALLRAVAKTAVASSTPTAALQAPAVAGGLEKVDSLDVAVANQFEKKSAPAAISTRERKAGWQKFAVAACLCVGIAVLATGEWLAQDVLILESKGRQVQHYTISDGSVLELDADSRVVVT
ncbi:MAG: DUF4880 domain-containing protein, partial [Gammaproteobacteria bacterium]|nr:DUF4880 domain-containing protein [Gammaproteobacteria bacterium]